MKLITKRVAISIPSEGHTKEIPLTKGYVALVDYNNYDFLNQWKWTFEKRYAVRKVNKKAVYMHRLVVEANDGFEVDHINGDPLDNRKTNLRLCTHAQNCKNTKIQTNNTSGYKGVSFNKDKKKWKAYINIDRVQKFLGYHADIANAACAYNKAAKEYFGEFARINNL